MRSNNHASSRQDVQVSSYLGEPSSRRHSSRRSSSANTTFAIASELSSSATRLVALLFLTVLLLCVSNGAVAAHGPRSMDNSNLKAPPQTVANHENRHSAKPTEFTYYSKEHSPQAPMNIYVTADMDGTGSSRFPDVVSRDGQTYEHALHAAVPPAEGASTPGALQFPRNLRRIYDGTWEISRGTSLPFRNIPVQSPSPSPPPSGKRASRPLSAALSFERVVQNSTSDTSQLSYNSQFSFINREGFVLLTAKNEPSTLSDDINVVTGDLLFRDGRYRSSRDVSFRLFGVYEWKTGQIVTVGDSVFEDGEKALKRLYASLKKSHTTAEMMSLGKGAALTEDQFVKGLQGIYDRRRKQARMQRPGGFTRFSVVTQCPFTASFAIRASTFTDNLPAPSEFAGEIPVGGSSEPLGGNRFAEAQNLSSAFRRQRERASSNILNAVRSRSVEDMGSGQEEMVHMKGKFVSEHCDTRMNFVLATLDTETLFVKAINYTLLVTVVAFTQVIVLIRQMEMTSTQAGASRVSLMTVGLQAVADSYLCLAHLTLGIAVQTLFNAFATAAFFKFICFSIFLMRWMLLIWKARRPSGFSEGWEAMRRELSMLYSRFYGSLLVGLFLLYQMQSHLRLFIFGLYSFWVPQIVLNIVEDHRRPLLPMYIIGTSITRLAIPLYFWGCPKNFLHIQPLPSTALALVGWMGAQAIVLLSQYKFGPRWFIPKALLPEKYDYFRPISVEADGIDDIEAQTGDDCCEGMVSQNTDQRRECCICMETVMIHSRDRMVTPCNHFFHAQCLERWLEVRLECALCRSAVPPP